MTHKKQTYQELLLENENLKKKLAKHERQEATSLDLSNDITFNNLFNVNEIQQIQNLFAEAMGVASIITFPNGVPITEPSNFCRLCKDVIRKSEKGLINCYYSDAVIGTQNEKGATYQPCLSGGLWDAGASISVGGKHIANWLIGQVKNESIDEAKMLLYAKEIGADVNEFKKALDEVPVMPTEKFKKIADALFLIANEISNKAYQNLQLNQLIVQLQEKEKLLIAAKEKAEENEIQLNAILEKSPTGFAINKISTGEVIYVNKAFTDAYHIPIERCSKVSTFFAYVYADQIEMGNKFLDDVNSGDPGRMKWDKVPITDKRTKTTHYISASNIILKELDLMISTVVDITSQVENENKLKLAKKNAEQSEILKNKLVANIGDVIVIIDQKGNNRYKSPNVEKLFGWKPEELLGKNAFDNIHPEDTEKARTFINSLLSEPNKTGTTEVRYRNKNGNYVWITFTGSNLLHDPIIQGILGNYHDITESKNTEIKLLRAQEKANKYTEMILSSQSLANICSYSTNLIEDDLEKSTWECSPEFYKIFGIDETYPHTIAGWAGFIHPDFRQEMVAYHEYVVKNRISFNKEYKIIRINDGIERWVRGTGELVYNKKGNPVRMHGAIQDITEIKKTEDELIKAKEKAEESEQRLKLASQSAELGIWDWDVKANTMAWDERMYALYGIKKEQFIKTLDAWINGLHPDDKEQAIADCNNALEGKSTFNTTFRVKHPDGNVLYIKGDGMVLRDAKGEATRMIGVNRDITESKLHEIELLIAKEKAEEANRLKTEFLHNMSHEIRTPMNGIIGFSQMLNKPDISEEKRKYFSKIVQNSSYQLLHIIDNILEISTLETQQVKLHESSFCLNDLIMELFSIFNLKSKERNIPFYVKKTLHDEQCHIISDKIKLNKILSNLLENAFKFTNQGYVELGYSIADTNLTLYVKDTGIGISEKNHELVFERFSQEDKGTSTNHGGLGLGLSICKENVKLLGGSISLTSEKDKGATFFVTIPYKPLQTEAKNAKEKGKHTEKADDKYTILIAEDEEVNYLYLAVLFEDEMEGNYKLMHAKNGKEAVEICMANPVDLVLMDVKMPVMSGNEATVKIKSVFPNLPVIAQTAYSTESDRALALKHGSNDFISKPIDKEKLSEMINKYLIYK